MEGLLQRQQVIVESLDKVIRNVSKDSASRKTKVYIKQRLETLAELWDEFEDIHQQLQLEDVSKSHDYFRSNLYEKAKLQYNQICDALRKTKPADTDPEVKEAGTPSKTDELIGLQRTNFRAFNRVVRIIEMSDINEKWEIEDKLQMLQNRWKTIDDIHWKIDNLLIGTELNYEQEYLEYENIYERTKKDLNRKLNITASQFKSVPSVEIPTFTGNYTQWPTFMDLYTEAIHNNPALSKTQKMQHLKGKLKGEAERIIQHLHISAENYDTCWEILTHRYHNLQLLFTKQIQTFMGQPALSKQSAHEIKRLHDTSLETIHAIHNLGVDTSTWDPILVHILTEKMDPETYTAYMESRKTPRDLPCWEEIITFLCNKFTALEPINKKNRHAYNTSKNTPAADTEFSSKSISNTGKYKTHKRACYTNTQDRHCPICNSDHILMYCKSYQNMTPDTKLRTINKMNICKNCLFIHDNKQCSSRKKCRVCNNPHHTSLHDIVDKTDQVANAESSTSTRSGPVTMPRNSNHVTGNFEEVLLATIELDVQSADGSYMKMRCLLDQGSQTNLMTESAAQRLGLRRRKQSNTVSGIGISSNQSHGVVQITCKSLHGGYIVTTEALVMAKMLNKLPNVTFEKRDWAHLQNITLADPDYNISRPIDILLDAGVYAEIVMDGVLRGPTYAPVAQQTKMGWVLLGNVKTLNCYAVVNNVDEISQYWELEEVNSNNRNLSHEDEYCENLYELTTQRRDDGRYEVKLPMKPHFEQNLGPSKTKATAQFLQLEQKLLRNKDLGEAYSKFITEYISLGHMKECTEPKEPSCFLPHHGVMKPDSLTTKLRTVFNASFHTKIGHNLNELIECGPKLQLDLLCIILRWRAFRYVYTSDIEKFYRQIYVQEEDQHLQKIVWRDDMHDVLKEYQLCTVTYGTKAAPFLALRTIQQLIKDDGHKYLHAVNTLNNQLYVDDILGGCNSVEEARETQNQLIDLLRGGGFILRKWASNTPHLLDHLPDELINQNMLDFKHAENNKTLGITWNPRTDQFTFKHALKVNKPNDVITKRMLLSDISKLYDPLGWLAPITIKTKLMFQQLWTSNIGWDDIVPAHIRQEWEQLTQDMNVLQNIHIPRCMGNTETSIELHGFCDASEKAYACAVYCKSHDNGIPTVKLIAAKTKLAPLKKKITLPRLELCGALLLSALMNTVIDSMKDQTVQMTKHAWTDSMIVLGWIQGNINRWKPFVAHRVGKILEILPSNTWNHVSSEDNAADCATRGIMPSQLLSHSLWWDGPQWLKNNELPSQPSVIENPSEEVKHLVVCSTQKSSPLITDILQKHSSMTRALRTLCWVSRFITNARDQDNALRTMHLTTMELERAHTMMVQNVQTMHFADDIEHLKSKNRVRSKSNLLNLSPVLDTQNILRVGGRLTNAPIPETQKHPIILPANDKLTELVVQRAHKVTLHGGAKLTLAYLRHTYWVLGGMRTVRQCVICHRYQTSADYQLMADLPSPRVTPSRPFTNTGVDFTGHVEVKSNKGRGIKTTKGYVAIFICLVTKAVHLELVSDLSTAIFLAAFNRLCSRRGVPKHMHSDNGTNFVGAAKALLIEHQETTEYYKNTEFMDHISELGVQWHFNAPAWPSAGGLWEAAVRSMKRHLKRVLGTQKLTYEEFTTLLIQIEGCLNSRPLVPITNDSDDVDCLTPGHFLIGSSILAPASITETMGRSLTVRWQLVQKMHQDFWRKWSLEYLQTLQTRGKWHCKTKNMEAGDVVVIKEDNTPPSKWLLGKVIETHPGADGQVRVVTLKTKNGTLKRPITKLSRLPVEPTVHTDTMTDNTPASGETQTRIRRTNRRKGTVTYYAMTLLLLIASGIGPALQQQTNITQLDPSKVMYFDKVADMQIIQDNWKLVVYYNLSSYWASLSSIEKYVNHLNSISTSEPAFQTIASQFQHEVNELKHYNNILSSEHGGRRRRGLINGVGYIANSLFGVLDERFAEQYNTDIQLLQKNSNHLFNLYKQHTSIIEGEYNLLKRNEEVMNKQFTNINNHLESLSQRMHEDYQNALYLTVNALAADVIISNLHRTQQLLLDLVTDIRNGRVDTHLLKPDQFEQQLNVISGQLPHGMSLPCRNNYYCTREMYKLSHVHLRMTTECLLFEIKVPLVNIEHYEMHRVISVPLIQANRAKVTLPTSPYLAINLRKDLIMPVMSEDLASCVHINKHQLLCNMNLPIYDIKTTTSVCEAQLINNNQLDYCRTTVSACTDKWIELQSQPGAWMFTCCQNRDVRIFCLAGGMTPVTLQGTGIISLGIGCVLKGSNVVIHSHYNLHSEITVKDESIYLPDSGVNHIINTKNISFVPEDHMRQLQALSEKITDVKDQQDSYEALTSIHVTHQTVMYSIITVVVLILAVKGGFTVRKYFHRRHNRSTPPTVGPIPMYTLPRRRVLPPVKRTRLPTPEQKEEVPTVSAKIDAATSPLPTRA